MRISAINASLPTLDTPLYTGGSMTVQIKLDDAAFDADYSSQFKCLIYTSDYYLMGNSEADKHTEYEWPVLTLYLQSQHVWLPGKYFLLINEKGGSLRRAELTITERMKVKTGKLKPCELMGEDDVLATCLGSRDTCWNALANTPGIGAIRQKALMRARLSVYNELRSAFSYPTLKFDNNMLFSTANQELNGDTLNHLRILLDIEQRLKMVDCSMLFDVTCNNPYERLGEQIICESDTLFCLNHIAALLNTGGKVIMKRIMDKVGRSDSDCLLWMCGTQQEVDSVLEAFPSIGDLFPAGSRIQLQPYTPFETVQVFHDIIEGCGLILSPETTDPLARSIIKGCEGGTLSSWTLSHIMRYVKDNIVSSYLDRALDDIGNDDDLTQLQPQDIDLEQLAGGRSSFEQSISELNEMIGLDDIKESITTLANRTRFYVERRRLGLPTLDKAVFHAIFTGNPGTGKTTVARMLGKIYHSLGLLSKGDVIAVDRTRLVGRYIGETEENMKSVLEEARGNVLFIDEAYTLYDGAADRKDFGARVIDSLLTVLTQSNPDMLIIFAGYEKEMDSMLSTNPGLFGRFPYKYRFQDYTAQELMQIACRVLQREAYVLTDEARSLLADTIAQTLLLRTKNFGNARWVEQYVRNGIIPALADRVSMLSGKATATLYQTIEAGDIKTGYEKFNPRTVELRPRRQVGFSA